MEEIISLSLIVTRHTKDGIKEGECKKVKEGRDIINYLG